MIETTINELIDSHNELSDLSEQGTLHLLLPIECWKWTSYQSPYSFILKQVELLVEQASAAECLSSPSEYIRELKRWLNEQRS